MAYSDYGGDGRRELARVHTRWPPTAEIPPLEAKPIKREGYHFSGSDNYRYGMESYEAAAAGRRAISRACATLRRRSLGGN